MNATQFWTIVLVIGLMGGAVVAARRLRSRMTAAGSRFRSQVMSTWDRMRDGVTALRGINLETWPDALADEAIRKGRPVPDGRVLALRYQIRCGTELYHEASPYIDRITSAFVDLLRKVVDDNGWWWRTPRVEIELDETVHPRTYRIDMIFPGGSPGTPKSATTLFGTEREPRSPDTMATVEPREQLASDWVLRLPDGRRHVIPLDTTVTIGSGTGCDIVLASTYVSRVNTTVTAQGPNLVVRDGDPWRNKRSTNGTLVDGHRVMVFTLTPDAGEVTVVLGGQTTIEIVRRASEPRAAAPDRGGS